MSELEDKGAFKFPEIAEGLEKLLKAQEKGNKINGDILLSKFDQKIRDNMQHEVWRRQKNQSTILSLVAIFIAGLALAKSFGIDVIGIMMNCINLFG